MALLFINPHTISLHRRFNLRRLGCAVRVKEVTRCQDGMRLYNFHDHHALNVEFFPCHPNQGLGVSMECFIMGIHILRSADQFPALLHKDVNQTDAYLGVLLNIYDADGRRNMRDDQTLFIESGKDFFG